MNALAVAGVGLAAAIVVGRKRGTSGAATSGGETLRGGGGRPWAAEPSAEVRTSIEAIADAYSIPRAFAFANAAHESRFVPRVGLDTLDGGAPDGAIPERSIGLMGVNVNPSKPVGQARIRLIKGLLGLSTDAQVVEALRDVEWNLGFWAAHIALPTIADVERSGATGRRKWLKVRLRFYGGTINLDGGNKWAVKTREDFSRTLDKWEAVYGVCDAGEV